MKTLQITEQEQSIIENALNCYWNEASEQLERNGIMMFDHFTEFIKEMKEKIETPL